ncbi:MAG TPA: hypothetical protein VI564_00895 [Candidatus Nanoarchaeia archaeon]|nr:hypothetical protein [Candidatus Nanoarchaeia archaeon]
MTQSIADKIKVLLDNDFVIRNCLFKNILSLRALARYMIKSNDLEEKNLDAVISAVRRYKREEKKASEKELKSLFKKITVKTKSDIVEICIQKNKLNMDSLSRINDIVDIEKGDVIRIVQAEESIRIMIDEKNVEKFHGLVPKSKCISIDKNLVEINLRFSLDASKVKGVVSLVTSSLNAEDVNLYGVMSCAPELLIFVKKEDLIKSITVIGKLEEFF